MAATISPLLSHGASFDFVVQGELYCNQLNAGLDSGNRVAPELLAQRAHKTGEHSQAAHTNLRLLLHARQRELRLRAFAETGPTWKTYYAQSVGVDVSADGILDGCDFKVSPERARMHNSGIITGPREARRHGRLTLMAVQRESPGNDGKTRRKTVTRSTQDKKGNGSRYEGGHNSFLTPTLRPVGPSRRKAKHTSLHGCRHPQARGWRSARIQSEPSHPALPLQPSSCLSSAFV